MSGINTASPAQVSGVNGQIGQIQAQILNIVNHDATLAAMAVGVDADGNTTTGFVALPAGSTPANQGGHGVEVAANDHGVQDHGGHAFAHMWG